MQIFEVDLSRLAVGGTNVPVRCHYIITEEEFTTSVVKRAGIDGKMAFVFVLCTNLRKVTVSSLLLC